MEASRRARAAEATLRVLVERLGGDAPGLQYILRIGDDVVVEHCVGHGDIVAARPIAGTSTFNLFSITKPFTAAAVQLLAVRGSLDLDAGIGVAAGLDGLEAYGTVRETLLHRAGFPNPAPLSWIHPREMHEAFNEAVFVHRILDRLKRTRRASQRPRYSNVGYLALGLAIERAGGRSLRAFIDTEIVGPLGPSSPESLGFSIGNADRHAHGHVRRNGLMDLLLRCLPEARRLPDGGADCWRRLRIFQVDGSAYGGLVGSASALARFGNAFFSSGGLPRGVARSLLEVVPGPGPARSLGWFAGRLHGHDWFAHAGGGIGYYGELRLYPSLAAVSVLLLNRSGLRDVRLLDRVDPAWLAEVC